MLKRRSFSILSTYLVNKTQVILEMLSSVDLLERKLLLIRHRYVPLVPGIISNHHQVRKTYSKQNPGVTNLHRFADSFKRAEGSTTRTKQIKFQQIRLI